VSSYELREPVELRFWKAEHSVLARPFNR
jgi:hypothetical protein